MTAVDAKHPLYNQDRITEWRTMRETYAGETVIKRMGERHLPKPSGWSAPMFADGGASIYAAYIARATFPEIVSNAIRAMVGVIHAKEPQIQIPSKLEYLWEKATPDGLPLERFAARITSELLLTGRYAVLADAPIDRGNVYLAGYPAESLINWSPDRDLFVLQEQVPKRSGFSWTNQTQTRVLQLVNGAYQSQLYLDGAVAGEAIEPKTAKNQRLGFIPLAVGGAVDMDLRPDTPPLIGVARAALGYYRLDADYRLALYQAYQDTLVFFDVAEKEGKNGQKISFSPASVGAGVTLSVHSKGDQFPPARAEYVSPSGKAIEAHEKAKQEALDLAAKSGARLFDNSQRSQESGEARRLRMASETATLQTVAHASASILERSLKNAAIFMGLDDSEVSVTPNKNLLQGDMTAQELQSQVGALMSGAISYETFYENLRAGGIASEERDAQEEAALIDAGLLRRQGVM